MEKKQTPVKWLVNVLLDKVELTEIEKIYIEQALKMEREQIIDAWKDGAYGGGQFTTTFDDLKLGIDEYFGPGKNQLEWIPYESKYPDEYEGYFKYEADDFNGGTELEEIKVYCVDFYPHTKYEIETE